MMIPITPDIARKEIQALFNTGWAGATPVSFDNDGFVPGNVPYVRVAIIFNSGELASLGAVNQRTFRAFGIVAVQVFTLSGTTASANDLLAQAAADIFKGVQTISGIWFRNTGIATVGNEGKWFQQNVSAEFIYDFIE